VFAAGNIRTLKTIFNKKALSLQLMKIRANKILVCLLFMMIFMVKMIISVAPVFLVLNNKTVNAAIMQLEQENKSEKDDPDKEGGKEKKFFDEDFQYVYHAVHLHLEEEKPTLLHACQQLYHETHHLAVPTPPPNAV
jgi:hypothetical protein